MSKFKAATTSGMKQTAAPRNAVGGLSLSIAIATMLEAGFAGSAVAQATGTSISPPSPAKGAIEEVIVTARRRSENLEHVAASVTAISSQQLRERQVFTQADLQRVSPGLVVRESDNNTQLNFSIRGQTIDAYTTSPPGVLPYINDVQITDVGPTTFYDLQSIQVLKGPQGTLFGRNTTGGAVLYTTGQPTDQFGGSLTTRFGNYGRKEVDAMINIPIVNDKVLLRIAGNFTQRDGYVTNILTGQGLGAIDDKSVRASLTIKPTDDFKNTTVVQVTETGGTVLSGGIYYLAPCGEAGTSSAAACTYNPIDPLFAQYAAAHPQVDPLGISHFFAAQQARGPYEVAFNSPSFLSGNEEYVTNTTSYEVNADLTIKNIAGYGYSRNHYAGDTDGTPFGVYNYGSFENIANSYGQVVTSDQYSEEPQLQGKLLEGHLDYILGGYYSHENDQTLFPQYFFDLAPFAPAAFSIDHNKLETTSEAAFAQGRYDLGDLTGINGLKLTGGVRWTVSQVTATQLAQSSTPGPVLSQEYRAPSWTVGLEYQLTPELLLYVTNRGSWRAGGINTYKAPSYGSASSGGSFFLPEYVKDVEAGLKYSGNFGGIPIQFNADGFNEWVKNVQRVVYLQLPVGPTAVTANVPAAEVSGFELDTQVRPLSWLLLGGNMAYTDARFTDDSVTIFGNTTTFGPYPDTPRWSGTLFGQVKLPVAPTVGDVNLRADFYAQSSFWFSSGGNTFDPGTKLPGYALTNFRLDWDGIYGSKFGASLFVDNAFNRTYYLGGLQVGSVFGLDTAIPGPPRMFGGELRFRF